MATNTKQQELEAKFRRLHDEIAAIAKPIVLPIDPVKMRDMCLWLQQQPPDALLAMLLGHAMWRD